MTKTWEELVLAGKKLIERQERHNRQVSSLKWAWADLALEVAPSVTGNAQASKVSERLDKWMKECDCHYTLSAVRDSRYVAKCWPKSEREPTTSFEVHKILRNHKEFMRPNLSRVEARKMIGYSNGMTSFEKLVAKLRRPEIVEQLIAEQPELMLSISRQIPRRRSWLRAA